MQRLRRDHGALQKTAAPRVVDVLVFFFYWDHAGNLEGDRLYNGTSAKVKVSSGQKRVDQSHFFVFNEASGNCGVVSVKQQQEYLYPG